MVLGAALAHDDIAGFYQLAAKTLDAQALGLGIAAVTCTTACFFMCHGLLLALFLASGFLFGGRFLFRCRLVRACLFLGRRFAFGCGLLYCRLGCGGFAADIGNRYFGVMLAMAGFLPMVLAASELDDVDFIATPVPQHAGGYSLPRQEG